MPLKALFMVFTFFCDKSKIADAFNLSGSRKEKKILIMR